VGGILQIERYKQTKSTIKTMIKQITHTCDVCKRDFVTDRENRTIGTIRYSYEVGGDRDERNIEVCPECLVKFKAFLSNKS